MVVRWKQAVLSYEKLFQSAVALQRYLGKCVSERNFKKIFHKKAELLWYLPANKISRPYCLKWDYSPNKKIASCRLVVRRVVNWNVSRSPNSSTVCAALVFYHFISCHSLSSCRTARYTWSLLWLMFKSKERPSVLKIFKNGYKWDGVHIQKSHRAFHKVTI